MRKNSELFKAAISGGETWNNYANSLSPEQVAASQKDLADMVKEVRNYFDNIQAAWDDIAERLRQIEEELEQSKRKRRREKAKKSLRHVLEETFEQPDGLLGELRLCTKTGAAVRLDALIFNVGGHQQEVANVNAARKLFQQKHNCKAHYNLYYIRDGDRSAGFGWDRPFLDEVFLV